VKKATDNAAGTIEVNRAPVLTLWAAVVARRLGYTKDAALTLGKAVAGLNAQSKGRKLGLYQPADKGEKPDKARKAQQRAGVRQVEVCGRPVTVAETDDGVRAVSKGKPISPEGVEDYLERSFGEHLGAVRDAMTALAKAYKPKELEREAYGLYERFRPAIPAGKKGWGAKGTLDLGLIRSLAEPK
jgi:hypothetical protein